MHVRIIIVNYAAAGLVLDCLRSLVAERADVPGLFVTVADNPAGGTDLEQLDAGIRELGIEDWVEVQPMARNGGLGYAVNVIVRAALAAPAAPDAFLLLNPDTYVRPGAIPALVGFLADNPQFGIVGSRLEDPDGTRQNSAFRFPGLASEFDGGLQLGIVSVLLSRHTVCLPPMDEPGEVDWLAGACMLVRREVFERVGLFDERFFLYYEELDFFRRAADLGVRACYVPASRVVHLVGRTTGVTVRHRRPDRFPAYWFESRRRYYQKHHGRIYAKAVDLGFVIGRCGFHLLRILRGRSYDGPPCLLRDIIRHNLLPRPRLPREST